MFSLTLSPGSSTSPICDTRSGRPRVSNAPGRACVHRRRPPVARRRPPGLRSRRAAGRRVDEKRRHPRRAQQPPFVGVATPVRPLRLHANGQTRSRDHQILRNPLVARRCAVGVISSPRRRCSGAHRSPDGRIGGRARARAAPAPTAGSPRSQGGPKRSRSVAYIRYPAASLAARSSRRETVCSAVNGGSIRQRS